MNTSEKNEMYLNYQELVNQLPYNWYLDPRHLEELFPYYENQERIQNHLNRGDSLALPPLESTEYTCLVRLKFYFDEQNEIKCALVKSDPISISEIKKLEINCMLGEALHYANSHWKDALHNNLLEKSHVTKAEEQQIENEVVHVISSQPEYPKRKSEEYFETLENFSTLGENHLSQYLFNKILPYINMDTARNYLLRGHYIAIPPISGLNISHAIKLTKKYNFKERKVNLFTNLVQKKNIHTVDGTHDSVIFFSDEAIEFAKQSWPESLIDTSLSSDDKTPFNIDDVKKVYKIILFKQIWDYKRVFSKPFQGAVLLSNKNDEESPTKESCIHLHMSQHTPDDSRISSILLRNKTDKEITERRLNHHQSRELLSLTDNIQTIHVCGHCGTYLRKQKSGYINDCHICHDNSNDYLSERLPNKIMEMMRKEGHVFEALEENLETMHDSRYTFKSQVEKEKPKDSGIIEKLGLSKLKTKIKEFFYYRNPFEKSFKLKKCLKCKKSFRYEKKHFYSKWECPDCDLGFAEIQKNVETSDYTLLT